MRKLRCTACVTIDETIQIASGAPKIYISVDPTNFWAGPLVWGHAVSAPSWTGGLEAWSLRLVLGVSLTSATSGRGGGRIVAQMHSHHSGCTHAEQTGVDHYAELRRSFTGRLPTLFMKLSKQYTQIEIGIGWHQ